MKSTSTVAETRDLLDAERAAGRTIGLVPTMGYLHEGHASLMRAAAERCDCVITTIFVNPLQFGAGEDLDAYPRDLVGDTDLALRNGVDVLFGPDQVEMYGEPVLTSVAVSQISERLEGRTRPTHFSGVATVVAKLFNIVGPCTAFFGEKDWQQLAVVSRMVRDLSFPVDVVGCATVREPDGLALSSRNAYLTPAERAAAPVVHRVLQSGADLIRRGERDPLVVNAHMQDLIAGEPQAELDYAMVVDAATLVPVQPLHGELRLLAAARFGRARLIDNLGVSVAPSVGAEPSAR